MPKMIIISFVLFVFSHSVFSQSDSILPVYKRFPTLPPLDLLLDDSVTTFTEKDIRKNMATLVFVFSPDCDHCQKETEELVDKIDQFKNIQIVMATTFDFSKMKNFIETYNLKKYKNITVGWDKTYLLPTFYRMSYFPFLGMYDKKGNLIEGVEGALPLDKVLLKFQQ